MNPLTSLLNFAGSFGKNIVGTPFAVALFNSEKSSTITSKDHLESAEKNEKEDELACELLRQCALKDRLLAIFAHDVRSPLSSLKALLSLLAKQGLSQKDFQRVAALLGDQVEHLSQFTENILAWTQNNSTEIKPKFQPLKLRPLVKETIGLLSPMADNKGIYIYSDVPESVIIYGDEEMVKLVLRNLIMNAIKFCDLSDNIYIHAKKQNEMAVISVCDTGRGISQENISDLFKISHVTTKGTQNEVGVGLGLTLCKEFVEKMGGTIRATSGEDKGSCFEFTVHSPTTPPPEFQKFIDDQEK